MSEYFIVLLLIITPTFLISFHPRSHTRGVVPALLGAIFLTAIPFILWDIWAYDKGLWGFNSHYISGVKLFGLPFEEVLFFVTIPYSSMYIWIVVRDFTTFSALYKRILNK